MRKKVKGVLGAFLVLCMLATTTIQSFAATKLYWPVPTNWTIKTGYSSSHSGVDIPASKGTPVYSNFDGTAEFYQVYTTIGGTKYLTSYGNAVYVDSSDGQFFGIYAHLNAFNGYSLQIPSTRTKSQSGNTGKILIGKKKVKTGELLGYVGTTGHSTGNHLHYELRKASFSGSTLNPSNYLDRSKSAKDLYKPTLSISYDANGGDIKSDKYKLISNVVYEISTGKKLVQKWNYNEPRPNGLYNITTFGITKKGNQFAGWSTVTSGGKILDQDNASLKPSDINENISKGDCSTKLYARWNPNVLSIYYNVNGGTIDSDTYYLSGTNNSVVYSKNTNNHVIGKMYYNQPVENGFYNASTFGLSRAGYQFMGWGTTVDSDKVFDQDDSTILPTSVNPNITNGNCSTILYAQWKPNTYTVKYNANGGVGTMADTAFTYNAAKTLPNNAFTRDGYAFLGWSVSPISTAPTYTDGQSVKNLTATNNGDVTLYAVWEKITVDRIAINTLPGKLSYYTNEQLDTAGLSINVDYTDGTKKITSEGFIVTAPDMTTTGNKKVIVFYGGAQTSFNINVERREINGECGANLKWTLDNNGEFVITGTGVMISFDSANEVPWKNYLSQIKSVTVDTGVTSIGDFAFYGCTNLLRVNLTDSIMSIGEYAFKNCSSVSEFVFPNGLKNIGESAFYGCGKIISLTFPENIEKIGAYAFSRCTGVNEILFTGNAPDIGTGVFSQVIANVDYPEFNATWTSDKKQNYGGTLIWKDYSTSENSWTLSAEGTLTISGLGDMENYQFVSEIPWNSERVNIKNVQIDEGVTSISDYAFYGCTNLESIMLPEGITTVGNYAFKNCSSLSYIGLPSEVQHIGESAFYGCSNLQSVEITENVINIENYAFSRCSAISSISFLGNAPKISDNSFSGVKAKTYYPENDATWTSVKKQNYGGQLTWIVNSDSEIIDSGYCGESTQWKLSGDGTLTISGTGIIKHYNGAALVPWNKYADMITSVVVENGITRIGEFAFYGCKNLTSVAIADSVREISGYVFKKCESLTEIALPKYLTKIGDSAFYGTGLTSIKIPATVNYVGWYAFSRCYAMSEVTFMGSAPNSQVRNLI